ncbi:hypothetical protein TNCT_249501 [Trichonephila clavata]|uniref:Uncharacterized protein n=1 Tax=Trichonephila clavata TaxID=2740835 RepID=A0A8X6LI60_TRICU|nr:hypothetical protein TNCT_249501 [Trichonephila clavata]
MARNWNSKSCSSSINNLNFFEKTLECRFIGEKIWRIYIFQEKSPPTLPFRIPRSRRAVMVISILTLTSRWASSFRRISEDSDFYLVDSAFKLLTSKDEEVVVQVLGQLTRIVRHRIRRTPTNGDLGNYLSGAMEGEFAESSNHFSNTWTLARKACSRQ